VSSKKDIDNNSSGTLPAERRTAAGLGDIARLTGVSKMTVSRVLRGGTGFSEDTRRKVLLEAERLGYVPNKLASAFAADQASTLVGVCVPRLTSGLFGHVLDGLDRALSRLGYQMMIGCSNHSQPEEEEWVRQIVSWRPAGVILAGRSHTPGTVQMLSSSGIPVVEMWDLTTSPIDLAVGFSHFDCGVEMAQFALNKGRRRAAYLGAHSRSDVMGQARLDGFSTALAEAGRPLVECEILEDAPSFYAGFYGLEILLARQPDLDLVYFHNDEMAIGGLAFCQARGLRVPEDIGIAGWGGMEAASILPKRLTTTVVPTTGLGTQAARALVARIRGEPTRRVIAVRTKLIEGETI
jgi:LacI family gluconate utilization system Gnt-I transcriptional repressor